MSRFTIPIFFQKLQEFEDKDTRFMKVNIWMCHTGKNANGTYFDKQVIEDAIPTLANTPILAFIEENSQGEKDFSDHRIIIKRDKDGYKEEYVGWAVGVIPETNNAHFDTRLCDDGETREFLVVSGLIWQNKFDGAPDIFKRDMIKSQSMELNKTDYDGYEDGDGYFHFTKFQFYGACCLGMDYEPAMINSTIELDYVNKNMLTDLSLKLEQWSELLRNQLPEKVVDYTLNSEKEGGKELSVEVINTILEDAGLTLDDLGITMEAAEEMTEEALHALIEEYKEDKSEEPESDYETKPEEETKDDEPTPEPEAEEPNDEEPEAPSEEPKAEEKDVDYVAEIDSLRTHISELESELEELRNYKSAKEQAERDSSVQELFTRFSELDGIAEFDELKESNASYSLEELEEKCYAIRGKNIASYSKKSSKATKIPVSDESHDSEDSGAYNGIFEKFGITK